MITNIFEQFVWALATFALYDISKCQYFDCFIFIVTGDVHIALQYANTHEKSEL